tara:strand:- start:1319 stop:1537 length:219 start_codon:yes stop_codon:yes gene_type:complete
MIFSSINLNYLSPTGFIGFWILLVGLIFTSSMFFFVFFRLNKDDASYKDRVRTKLAREEQKAKIAKLYPKQN